MRRIAVGIVGVLLVVGMAPGAVAGASAGASVPPSVRVSKHLGLRDGRDVTVRWRGFLSPTKGKTIQFLQVAECSRKFTVETATFATYVEFCTEYYAQMSTHRGFWQGEVHTGRVDNGDDMCAADACEIAVVAGHDTPDHSPVLELAAVAPIEFRS